MKNYLLSRLMLMLLSLLPLLATTGCGEKDDPTPTGGGNQKIELRANYSGMEYLGGTFTAFNVSNSNSVITQFVLPGSGSTANNGTASKDLGSFPAGTKILVRVEMTGVRSANDASQLFPRSTTPRPGVYPTYLDVDIVSDGRVIKTVTLDSLTPTNWQGRTTFYTEYTATL